MTVTPQLVAGEQSSQAYFLANIMYDNGQRSAPMNPVNVTVTTRWVLVR